MKNKAKIPRLATLVLLAIILTLSGCTGKTDSSKQTDSGKGSDKGQIKQVIIAQGVDVAALDPQKQSDNNTHNVITGIFDSLLMRDNDMSIKPSLATEYKSISDTEWEVKLRQGVKFHDGEPFNADIVKFTFDRLMDPNTKALAKPYFTTFTKVEVIDPYTVKFTTNGYDPMFAARLTNFIVIPPAYIKEKGDDYFNQHPVGTGPFKFVEWIKDDRVVMEANPDYFLGKPAFDRIVFRVVPEMATRIAGLQGGQIDILPSVAADQVDTLKNNNSIEILSNPSAKIQMLNFNTGVAPGNNKDFRLAVAYAIDTKSIVEGLFGQYANEIDIPISGIIPNAPKDIKRLPYDPEKAKALLKKAGLEGIKLDMLSQNGRAPLDKEIAQVIAQQLSKVGITANVQPTEAGQYSNRITSKTITPLFVETGNNIWFDTNPQLLAFYYSKGPLSVYSNEQADKLILEAGTTKDEGKRSELYRQAYETIRDDAGGIGILQYKNISAMNKKIKWTPRADETIWPYDIGLR